MELTCPHCGRVIKLKQKHFYHAGFNDRGFLYCDTNAGIFEFSSFNSNYERLAGNKHPWTLDEVEKGQLETHISPCPCGGRFRFDAYPRCPYCRGDLTTLLPDKIHFIEIGDVVDGDKDEAAWQF